MNYMPRIKEQTIENESAAMKKLLKDIRKGDIQLSFSERFEMMFYLSDYLQQENISCSFIMLVIRCLECVIDNELDQFQDTIPDIVKSIRVSLMKILQQDICPNCKFAIVRFLAMYRHNYLLTKKNVKYIDVLNKKLKKLIRCEHMKEYLISWDINKNNSFNYWIMRMIPSIFFILLSVCTPFKLISLLGFIVAFQYIQYKYPMLQSNIVMTQDCLDCSCVNCCSKCHVTVSKKTPVLKDVQHKQYVDETVLDNNTEIQKMMKESLNVIPEEEETGTETSTETENEMAQEIRKRAYEQTLKVTNVLQEKNITIDPSNPPILLPESLGQDLYDLRDKLKSHNPVNEELLKRVEEGIRLFEQIKSTRQL